MNALLAMVMSVPNVEAHPQKPVAIPFHSQSLSFVAGIPPTNPNTKLYDKNRQNSSPGNHVDDKHTKRLCRPVV